MKRRDFLKAVGAGAVLAALPLPVGAEADPNVCTVERLVFVKEATGLRWCFTNPIEYEAATQELTVFSPGGYEPLWVPCEWSDLIPYDVFRVREPDGTIVDHGQPVSCAAGWPHKTHGVWGIKADPLKSIREVVGGRVHIYRVDVAELGVR